MVSFDRSFLSPSKLEFVVFGDTHFIRDPEAYAVEFASVLEWNGRATYAVSRIAALECPLAIHLGDISEEPPEHPDHEASRKEAEAVMSRHGLQPEIVAGNMDIGDKPDPTMWTPPANARTLSWFHERYGNSWRSFTRGPCRFILINSQILNSDLPESREQASWLEKELEAHAGSRILLFLHMPPFFVDEKEPDTGFYNSVDEPARSWLSGLLRRHAVEALFCGHTHFRAFNRCGPTRLYVCPSTTTSRAGFYEAFSVAPAPESGRNDPPKLGFYLVRVTRRRLRVHFIRTAGHTAANETETGWSEVLTRTSGELPQTPLGLHLRSPLAQETPGILAWPGVKRQRVRDDHPFLQALELGARHLRVPGDDCRDPLLSRRLAAIREEEVAVTAIFVDSPRLKLEQELAALPFVPDAIELQLPGCALPGEETLHKLAGAARRYRAEWAIAPLLPRERTPGRYHPRGRLGFRLQDLEEVARRAANAGLPNLRVLAAPADGVEAHEDIRDWAQAVGALESISGFDFLLSLPSDESVQQRTVALALTSAVTAPGCRLFLDPYVDLDRSNDPQQGLLDRLGNPRAIYHLVRSLNTVLGSRTQWVSHTNWFRCAEGDTLELAFTIEELKEALADARPEDSCCILSLPRALSRHGPRQSFAPKALESFLPLALLHPGHE